MSSIFTESCESLAELEKSTIKILSAATGYKYSAKEIVEKVKFVMTDSTTHNIKVFDSVWINGYCPQRWESSQGCQAADQRVSTPHRNCRNGTSYAYDRSPTFTDLFSVSVLCFIYFTVLFYSFFYFQKPEFYFLFILFVLFCS